MNGSQGSNIRYVSTGHRTARSWASSGADLACQDDEAPHRNSSSAKALPAHVEKGGDRRSAPWQVD
eukprot:2206575-Rhodomonas_salina.1